MFQLTIRAQDNGTPRLSDTETVFVTILRNMNAPVFSRNAYSATILETQAPGTSVLNVQATDADIVVSLKFWLDKKYGYPMKFIILLLNVKIISVFVAIC